LAEHANVVRPAKSVVNFACAVSASVVESLRENSRRATRVTAFVDPSYSYS
jgi:hypothetical protein